MPKHPEFSITPPVINISEIIEKNISITSSNMEFTSSHNNHTTYIEISQHFNDIIKLTNITVGKQLSIKNTNATDQTYSINNGNTNIIYANKMITIVITNNIINRQNHSIISNN